MYPVFESIAVKDGRYLNVPSHLARMQKTAKALWGIELAKDYLEKRLPAFSRDGLYKCRFMYNQTEFQIDIKKYSPRLINTLLLKEVPNLFYEFKYTYRESIDLHKQGLSSYEDILFTRGGYLLDTSYANVALLKKGTWYTPKVPLLLGTQRHDGIKRGILIEKSIHKNHIEEYEKICWFNAMMPIGERVLPIESIQFLENK